MYMWHHNIKISWIQVYKIVVIIWLYGGGFKGSNFPKPFPFDGCVFALHL